MAASPYDPTLKALVETDPASWPALLGTPAGPTEVIDADVATVSGAADKVLRVSADPPYLLPSSLKSAAQLPSSGTASPSTPVKRWSSASRRLVW